MSISIKQAVEQAEKVKRQLIEHIEKMPDNPEVQQLSDSPNCLSVNLSTLQKHDAWSPNFHSMRHQKELLSQVVRETRIDKLGDRLRFVAEEGKIPHGVNRGERVHPVAIKHLRKVIE